MRTLAGSGNAGFVDGPASTASFLMPVAIAVSKAGQVFVVDRAAQRIRMVFADRVTTVAGGGSIGPNRLHVIGGFANGPALLARFDEPTGIAAAPDGGMLISDMLNHCIRRLANGIVSTFAGVCGQSGKADGDLTSALFTFPHGIDIDRDGTIWIADDGNALRRIDRSGQVTRHSPEKCVKAELLV